MKYIRIILSWVISLGVLGFIYNFVNENDYNDFVYTFALSLGLLYGISRALFSFFSSKSKSKILKSAMKMYNGKTNLNGENEIIVKERRIILDYKLESVGNTGYEYIISNIFISNLEKELLNKCKANFEIIEHNYKYYVIVYSSWGYKGNDFKEQIEKNIGIINMCINNSTN
jgi:hypothetical protein